ncbi:amidohydrolase family protein (plasmid) [Natrinema zhouii]|uniref:dihydroorotase n=1 Tax=Natrinema zhouii TaxID=1710539 RepID=UPI001CFFFE43|nr:amidohydrolase family protein [Natrinema zhouii]UHQ98850.1 amidohydrolase family protein [Natrinema zhouii]
MPVDTVITGGRVVTTTDVSIQSIAIDDGEIVAIGAEDSLPEANERINASGKIVMPGVVDPHVHIDEVPENRAGTYEAESAAAALGGVTTFIDFSFQGKDRANSEPGAPLIEGIRHKQSKGEDSYVDFSLHSVLRREDRETFDELEAAIDAGVTSFKMFRSTYDIGVGNGFIHEAFRHIADHDAVAALHTEDPAVCKAITDRMKREGKGNAVHYPDSRPDYAEAMAAEDAVRMAIETGVKYYGVHTSCQKAAAVIDQFQDDGSSIRAETCTHYTIFDRSRHDELGNFPLIAPPLRTADDVEAMFNYLDRGTLSVVSTDHSVYYKEFKKTDDWWDAPFGATGLQFSLPVFHEVAINRRDYSYPFLVRTMCTNPAQTFGMPQKGTLEPGTDADVVVFDPDQTKTISSANKKSNDPVTIYEDVEVNGTVMHTFVRGNQVVADGELVANPGTGEFVKREIPDWSI